MRIWKYESNEINDKQQTLIAFTFITRACTCQRITGAHTSRNIYTVQTSKVRPLHVFQFHLLLIYITASGLDLSVGLLVLLIWLRPLFCSDFYL